MIVVTQEMTFARRVGDRVMFDKGRLVEEGRQARIFEHPAAERTREFRASGRRRCPAFPAPGGTSGM